MAEPAEEAPQETGAGFPAPVRFGEAVGIAARLYRRSGAPASVIGIFMATSLVRLLVEIDMPRALEFGLSLALIVIVPLLVGAAVFAALARMHARAIVGEELTFGAAFGEIAPRIYDFVLLGTITAFIVAFLMFSLLGILGVFLLFPMFLGPPIFAQTLAIEKEPFREGSRRARSLLAGNWGRLFLYLFSISVPIGLAAFAIPSALSNAIKDSVPYLVEAIAYWVSQGLIWGLAFPYVAAFGLVMYLDLRARKEELDEAGLRAELAS